MKDKKAEKRKVDKSKIITKILAGVMAGLMLLGVSFTLIYYLVKVI